MSCQQADAALHVARQSVDAVAVEGADGITGIADVGIDGHQIVSAFALFLAEVVHLVEHERRWHAIGLGRCQEAVDEGGARFGACHRHDEQCQVDVGRQDVALLREVGCFSDDVVPPVVDFRDEERLVVFHLKFAAVGSLILLASLSFLSRSFGRGFLRRLHDGHAVAHRHRTRGADASQAEVAFHLAFHLLSVVGAYHIAVSCISYNDAVHENFCFGMVGVMGVAKSRKFK